MKTQQYITHVFAALSGIMVYQISLMNHQIREYPAATPEPVAQNLMASTATSTAEDDESLLMVNVPDLQLPADDGDYKMHLGRNFYTVLSPTGEFAHLIAAAKSLGKNALIVDIHFNKSGSSGASGYLQMINEAAMPAAQSIDKQFSKMYKEKSWAHDTYRSVNAKKAGVYSLLRESSKRNVAAIVNEVGFVDDRKNKDLPGWINSEAGHQRIAAALIEGLMEVEDQHDAIVLTIGHHGSRGTNGATWNGIHEKEYAMSVINEVWLQLAGDRLKSHARILAAN